MTERERAPSAVAADLVAAIERAAADLGLAEEPAGLEAAVLRVGQAYEQAAGCWSRRPPSLR